MQKFAYSGTVLSYSYKRLELLHAMFNLHVLLNSERELEAQKCVPHRDFYNVRKCDTHVHHSGKYTTRCYRMVTEINHVVFRSSLYEPEAFVELHQEQVEDCSE
jgi:hypothetical protein